MHNMGVAEFERGRYVEAAQWFRKAVDAGRAESTNNLALALKQHGHLDEAEHWYRQASDQGDTIAMANLGVLLAERRDNVEAEHWFLRAYHEGNSEAAHSLAVLYQDQGKAHPVPLVANAPQRRSANSQLHGPSHQRTGARHIATIWHSNVESGGRKVCLHVTDSARKVWCYPP